MNWNHVSKYRSQLMGIFCIMVMLFHNRFKWTGMSVIKSVFAVCNSGVDCFMFVSGIGLYYSFSNDPDILTFYRKRFLRLIIPFLLIAGPFFYWRVYIGGSKYTIMQYFTETVFFKYGVNSTWFVPAIAGCYVAFPLIYHLQNTPITIGGKKLDRNTITVFILILCFFMLRYMQASHPVLYKNIEIALTRSIIFVLGCHCGKWVKEGKKIPAGVVPASAFFVILYIFVIRKEIKLERFWTRLIYAPFALACVIIFVYALYKLDERFGIKSRFLSFIGGLTLELYLSHIALRGIYSHHVGFGHIEKTATVDYLLVLLMSLIWSLAVHRISELIVRKNSSSVPASGGLD